MTPMILPAFRLRIIAIFTLLLAASLANAQNSRDETTADISIIVNPDHPRASDRNNGEENSPLSTIGGALALAASETERGQTVRVRIHAGMYRESLSWSVPGESDIGLIMEAAGDGEVIVSGSEIWTGWRSSGAPGLYVHDWPFRWGPAYKSKEWKEKRKGKLTFFEKHNDQITPDFWRREMIFVNGRPLRQVMSEERLTTGTFLVDETRGKVSIALSAGVDPETATVEVSVRPRVFEARKSGNITIRGLTFQHANSMVYSYAVNFETCENVTLEDCSFLFNNWRGLKIANGREITLRRCIADDNGAVGIDMWRVRGLLMENCITRRNNWRGANAGIKIWALSGVKLMFIHKGVIRGHLSRDNRTRGFWFDNENRDVLFEDCTLINNELDGIFVEASPGPVTLKNCTIAFNGRDGVRIANSDNLTIENNRIYGNKGSQVYVSGSGRVITNWDTGAKITLKNLNCRIIGNTIAAESAGERLFGTEINAMKIEMFFRSLTSDNNRWYHPDPARAFQVRKNKSGGKFVDFNGWKRQDGLDAHSEFSTGWPSELKTEN